MVSPINCCKLPHLEHVFYPRITSINHDLMLHLNSYRQAIYSWLDSCILCNNFLFLCVCVRLTACWQRPLLADISHSFCSVALAFSKTLVIHMTRAHSYIAATRTSGQQQDVSTVTQSDGERKNIFAINTLGRPNQTSSF